MKKFLFCLSFCSLIIAGGACTKYVGCSGTDVENEKYYKDVKRKTFQAIGALRDMAQSVESVGIEVEEE